MAKSNKRKEPPRVQIPTVAQQAMKPIGTQKPETSRVQNPNAPPATRDIMQINVQDILNPNKSEARTRSSVVFNPDRTVTVGVGDVVKTMSRDEYNRMLETERRAFAQNGKNFDKDTLELNAALEAEKKRVSDIQAGRRVAPTPEELEIIKKQTTRERPREDVLAAQDSSFEKASLGATFLGGVAAGATGGAIAGSVAPVVGNVAGAVIGGVVGGVGATIGKLTVDQRGKVKNAIKLHRLSKQNIDVIINRLNSDPTYSTAQAYIDFEEQRQNILLAESYLKKSNTDVNKLLSGGFDEMLEVQQWLGFNLPLKQQELDLATLNPNPTKQIQVFPLEE